MSDTTVVISTSGQEFNLPGTDWTAASIKSAFTASVPGIAAMDANVVDNPDGSKVFTFSPRSGTKG